MTLHDANLGDIYRDETGTIWRVFATCAEPTVHVEMLTADGLSNPVRKSGGVSGFMWNGFVKLEPKP